MGFPIVIRDAVMPGTRDDAGAIPLLGEEEFRAFYERTARPLWAYLSRLTGDRQATDDLLQEAYYRFYRAGDRHESESHRRNSLFQIATNVARDAARRARYRDESSLDDDPSSAPVSHSATPERQVQVKTDLQRAMDRLEPLQRELLWLAYAQGASHEEIAGILGLRAVSIRTLLLRARRKVVRFLSAADGVTR